MVQLNSRSFKHMMLPVDLEKMMVTYIRRFTVALLLYVFSAKWAAPYDMGWN